MSCLFNKLIKWIKEQYLYNKIRITLVEKENKDELYCILLLSNNLTNEYSNDNQFHNTQIVVNFQQLI